MNSDNPSWQVAKGNLVTTQADLAEWGRRLYTGNAGLEREYVKMMMDAKKVSDTGGYGLGCSYSEGIGYGHSGAVSGYLSMMTYDPDDDLSIDDLQRRPAEGAEYGIEYCQETMMQPMLSGHAEAAALIEKTGVSGS